VDDPRFGIGLWQGAGPRRQAELAELAEHEGLDHAWLSNHKLYAELFVGLTAAAMRTSRIGLGTFVADPYSMHPALVAAAIAAVDEVSGGRAILGLGVGGANFRELGLDVVRPAQAMREAIGIVKPLLRGDAVTIDGQVFRADGAHLRGLTPRPDLPIVVASRGDRVLEVAGEHADAAMIATYATVDGLRHGREMVALGLARRGRDVAGFPLFTRVDVVLSDDRRAGFDAVRPMIAAMVMASYPDDAFLRHAGLEITPGLAAMAEQKDEALAFASGHLVPDDFAEHFAWVGTPAEVSERIAAVVDSGFSDVVVLLQPMSVDPAPQLRSFAREVIPRVRAHLGTRRKGS
jgi:5,10-methylenetetrahydromethanopterin reductase